MEWIALVTGLALLEYMVLTMRVGLNRERYGIAAPATSGNDIWERHFRVQQNSVEQLVIFLPALWVFGEFVSAPIGAAIGVAFIIGRAIYAIGYVAEPGKRTAGFLIGFLCNVVLVVGSIGGAIARMA
jgi:glutathione S-transferase